MNCRPRSAMLSAYIPGWKEVQSTMIPYPQIDPDLVTIGPIHIRWYGVMYVLGFVAAYFFIQRQERSRQVGLVGVVAQDLVFYLAIGLIVGARLGYLVFYQYHSYLSLLR